VIIYYLYENNFGFNLLYEQKRIPNLCRFVALSIYEQKRRIRIMEYLSSPRFHRIWFARNKFSFEIKFISHVFYKMAFFGVYPVVTSCNSYLEHDGFKYSRQFVASIHLSKARVPIATISKDYFANIKLIYRFFRFLYSLHMLGQLRIYKFLFRKFILSPLKMGRGSSITVEKQ
jgi:hypothetical protein